MPGQFLSYLIVLVSGVLTVIATCAPDMPVVFGFDPKALLFDQPFLCPVVLSIKLGAGLCTLIFGLWALYRQQHRPFHGFEDLRNRTFKIVFNEPINKIRDAFGTADIQLSVMRANAYVRIGKKFEIGQLKPIYHHNSTEDGLDRTLCFWYINFFKHHMSQGVCGTAFLSRVSAASFEEDIQDEKWNLSEKAQQVTKGLQALISIPIAQERGKFGYRYIGVINISSRQADFAKIMTDKENKAQFSNQLHSYLQDVQSFAARWL